PDVTIDALYAFTDCQNSISVNACVIVDNKPMFLTVDEILRISAENTKDLLKRELEIKQSELNEKWHFSSLEKIFIEKRIYRDIEEEATWEGVLSAIDKGLKPYKKLFKREITEEDIVRLTEIKIKRISKFDAFKADEEIKGIENSLKQVAHDLEHLTDFAIAYFEELLKKYGKGRERKTELKGFETIEVKHVAANNAKLYVNRAEGFFGTGLKKDEFVGECSDIDDILVITRSGKMMISRLGDKKFVGKEIIHIAVWQKGDERTAYNIAYYDGISKRTFAKRFNITGITRDKEYDITQGTAGSKLLYFTANNNSETEIVRVQLHPNSSARNKEFEFDFATLDIKGRGAMGNILTKFPVRKIDLVSKGESSIGGLKLWFDAKFGRLATEEKEKSTYLGEFNTGDNVLVVYKDGNVELTNFETTNKYEMDDIYVVEKFSPDRIYSLVYFDGASKQYYVKRFKIELKAERVKASIISEHKDSKLSVFSSRKEVAVAYHFFKGKEKEKNETEVKLSEIIDVKGWKALGNRLTQNTVTGKIVEKVYEDEVAEDEDSTGLTTNDEKPTTIEWDLKTNPNAGKSGKQGGLF
ncbi:MAG TPA: DNA gyrase subunit A, partial [Chitinophagales bacterium]